MVRPGQRGVGEQPDERSLEFADVRLDLRGDVHGHVVGQRNRLGIGLFPQDCHLGLEIRRLHVGDESPLEARSEALFEPWNVMRRAVAAEDDLLLRVVEGVEGVEELVLRAFLAGDELDVVDEQDVDRAVALTELQNPVVADGVDHLVHETFRRDVGEPQPRRVLHDVLADGVHQVGLAQADAAVDEQRVVGERRCFGHRPAGGVRELVRGADDEGVEGVARVQPLRRHRRRRFRHGVVQRLGSGVGRLGAAGQKREHRVGPARLAQGLGQHDGVVFREPVLEEGIGNADCQRMAVVGHEAGRLEPRVEAVAVDLAFDLRQDVVPDICRHIAPGLTLAFPQGFPHLWKTWRIRAELADPTEPFEAANGQTVAQGSGRPGA